MPAKKPTQFVVYSGTTVEFTSTAKRGRPSETIVGKAMRQHTSRGSYWWEVATSDGRNWRVPERMLRAPSKKVSKKTLEKGVKAAVQRKNDIAEFKAARKEENGAKVAQTGAFDNLRVGMLVLYRGEQRRIAKLMPEIGKVSLEVSARKAERNMVRGMVGLRTVNRTAVWAHWVTPLEK